MAGVPGHASHTHARRTRRNAPCSVDIAPAPCPGRDDDDHVDQIIDYNRKAQAFAQQMQAEQEALLLQCAGLRTAQAS
ncbi:hypothetical protein CJO94_09465 [Ralstonia solanacearum]|nr:hypothetical protein CJO94_09465 [Ralstonia solanacearum]